MKSSESDNVYSRYLDAKCRPTPNGRYSTSALADMQLAIRDAFKGDGPLPSEMRRDLLFAFDDLCAGIANELLMLPFRGTMKPIRRHLQEDAIRYLRWVEDGRISDPLAVHNVAQWYGVSERTVRRWVSDWGVKPTPGLHGDFGKDLVITAAKESGARYYKW